MEFNVTEIRVDTQNDNYIGNLRTHRQLDVTIEGYFIDNNFSITLDDVVAYFKGHPKIHPDAPSYEELLKKHAPEFLV
jgi:hypothetical protein